MAEQGGIKPFLCDAIDKASIRVEWQKWIRAFQLYLDSENINDNIRKRNKLLHLGGMQLQEVAYNIPGAIVEYRDEDQNDVFQILVEALTTYFSPTQNSTFERHTFRNLKPMEGETLNKFLVRLRQQATKCSFGNNAEEATEISIKDKIIDNWASLDLKRKLLEKERSLSEIIDICQVHEQILDQSKVMGSCSVETPSTSINKISVRGQNSQVCSRCGANGHIGTSSRCPAKNVKCHKCELTGHFASKCRTKSMRRPNRGYDSGAKRRRMTSSRVNYLDPGASDDEHERRGDSIKDYECFRIDNDRRLHYSNKEDELIECKVGGIPITLLIDSGSKANVINGRDWEILTTKQAVVWNISNTKDTLKPYAAQQSLDIRHQFQTTVGTPDNNEIVTSFFVVDKGDLSILGKDAAKRLGILKLGLGVNRVEKISIFPKVRNVKVALTINKSIKPVQQPLRRVPIAVEALVEAKLEEALQRDIIEPVEGHSPWISPIVVIYKGSDHHIFGIVEQSIFKAMSISEITTESLLDPELVQAASKVIHDSWETSDKNAYYPFRLELTTMGPILLRNNKIVIPVSQRTQVLTLAHEGHPGETVMKRRLRAKVWWPLIDRQVEQFVKKCRDCLLVSRPEKPPPMARHNFPNGPWECLAIDLMGPLPNQEQVLVLIDYYSRYQSIKFLRTTTSSVVIKHLEELFCQLGIPKSIRADNGKQFSSREFQDYCKENNIQLIHTPPYWPQANGEVENMNKSILKRLQICQNNKKDYKSEIQKFIMMHNVTPHETTGKSPSELIFNRRIRDKIPSITDIVGVEVDSEAQDNDLINKFKGKRREDIARQAKENKLQVGDKVVVQNLVILHKLTSRFGATEYVVTERKGNEVTLTGDGKTMKRHVAHVKRIPSINEADLGTSTSGPTQSSSTADESNQSESSGDHPSDQEATVRVEPLKLKKKRRNVAAGNEQR